MRCDYVLLKLMQVQLLRDVAQLPRERGPELLSASRYRRALMVAIAPARSLGHTGRGPIAPLLLI